MYVCINSFRISFFVEPIVPSLYFNKLFIWITHGLVNIKEIAKSKFSQDLKLFSKN